MDIEAYLRLALESFDFAHPGAFFGAVADRSLGAGLIYDEVVFPLYNENSTSFDTVQGLAYVVTHECDIDQDNDRYFNEFLVICPLIPLGAFVEEYESALGEEQLKSFLVSAAKNDVFRVFFLPPAPELLGVAALRQGAVLYLNQLCSAHVSVFAKGRATPLCALSSDGFDRLVWKFENLLFRPRTEPLPRVR